MSRTAWCGRVHRRASPRGEGGGHSQVLTLMSNQGALRTPWSTTYLVQEGLETVLCGPQHIHTDSCLGE